MPDQRLTPRQHQVRDIAPQEFDVAVVNPMTPPEPVAIALARAGLPSDVEVVTDRPPPERVRTPGHAIRLAAFTPPNEAEDDAPPVRPRHDRLSQRGPGQQT